MTTYSISLDDVDLALLPVRSRRYNDFLKKEYYEFKVTTSEAETKDEPIIEQYKCHICAIDVPTAFSSEHCAGAKHQANLSIATTASQRMRNLATARPFIATPQITGRFCDPCATVAAKDHDKTKEHRVAVIHDNLLCQLAKLYVEDDLCDEKDNSNVRKEDNAASKSKAVNANTQTHIAVDNKQLNGEATEDDESSKYVKIPMNLYIKILKSVPVYPKIPVKAVGGNIQINIDTDQMLVSSDYFHSFYRTEKKLMCNICMKTLKTDEEEIHKLAVPHMESVMQVVDDSHCIRKMNENWSHCILCNLIINNAKAEDHKTIKTHLKNRREAIVSQKLAMQLTETEKAELKFRLDALKEQETSQTVPAALDKKASISADNVSRTDIPKNQVILAANQKTQTTVKNVNAVYKNTEVEQVQIKNDNVSVNAVKSVINPQIRTEIMLPDSNQIDYPFEPIDQGSVRCTVCACVVPRNLDNRIGHLNGQRHANSLKKHFPPL